MSEYFSFATSVHQDSECDLKYGRHITTEEGVPITNRWNAVFKGGAAIALAVSFVLYVGAQKVITYSAPNELFTQDDFRNASFEVSHNDVVAVVTNEYTFLNLKTFDYPFLDDTLFMEPHRENTVTMRGLGNERTGKDSDFVHTWTLTGIKANKGLSYSGELTRDWCIIVPKSVGSYELLVTNDLDWKSVSYPIFNWTCPVVVKYVRRNIQSLNDFDREEFLDAFRTLWDVNTKDGMELYGNKRYKSLYYFAQIHNDAGGNPACDEFHRNAGFIHNHIYLGLFFEQSLQMVNPRTCLHYWEYTSTFSKNNNTHFEKHYLDQMDGGTWTELMTSKYFGQSDPITGEIVNGRWAHTRAPRVNQDFFRDHGISPTQLFFPDDAHLWQNSGSPHVSSPYGLLRSPWNFSPANFTIRFNNVARIPSAENLNKQTFKEYLGSTCDDYKALIGASVVGKPLMSYLMHADAQAHGYIHYTIAGTGGQTAARVDEQLKAEFGYDNNDIAASCSVSSDFFKTWLQRGTVPDSPMNCSKYPWDPMTETFDSNIAEDGIKCTVNAFYFQDENKTDWLWYDLWDIFIAVDHIHARDLYYDLTFEQKKRLLTLMFHRQQHDGDMATSSSATDPFFWVAHGAIERLYQRVIFEDVLSDSIYATDTSSGGYSCQGHAADSKAFYLTGLELESTNVKGEVLELWNMTNSKLSATLDPTSDRYAEYIPFIYDRSTFEWCGSEEEVAEWFK